MICLFLVRGAADPSVGDGEHRVESLHEADASAEVRDSDGGDRQRLDGLCADGIRKDRRFPRAARPSRDGWGNG